MAVRLGHKERKEQGYVAPIAKRSCWGKGVANTCDPGTRSGGSGSMLSEGMYIPAGTPIVVTKVEGSRIIVAKLSE